MKPGRLRVVMNLWPPYLAAGIRVAEISADWHRVRVELRSRPWNRNYVGTHFGGSLFAMTDPFYMLMYLHLLGRDYILWDYAAAIRYLRPGRGTARARFELSQADVDRVVAATADGQRFLHEHSVGIVDSGGEEVARVERTLYFRRKSATASGGSRD